MAADATENGRTANGWTPLAETPKGAPQAELARLAPLLAELEELEAHVARTRAVNPDNQEIKGMEFVIKRIRARIWEATQQVVEQSPEDLGAQLGVTAQTIRNWCKDPNTGVRSRRVGSRYVVDVKSALRYAGQS